VGRAATALADERTAHPDIPFAVAVPSGLLEAGPAGYRLALQRVDVDVTRAQDLLGRARAAQDSADHAGALRLVAETSALWRGEAGADLPTQRLADELRTTVQALRSGVDAVRLQAQLGQGQFAQALPGLRERCAEEPLDEPAHEALMRCLASLGRTNEALAVFAELRSRLAEELGADPAPALVGLHTQLLRGELVAAPPEARALRRWPRRSVSASRPTRCSAGRTTPPHCRR